MVICAPQPRRDPASCCMVDVVNGGLGRSVRGDSSIDLTVSGTCSSDCASCFALVSSSSRMFAAFFSFSAPLASKSFVAASRLSSTESNRASKPSHFAVKSHQADEIKAMRSRSRSTIKRVATDCTRPAEMRHDFLPEHWG